MPLLTRAALHARRVAALPGPSQPALSPASRRPTHARPSRARRPPTTASVDGPRRPDPPPAPPSPADPAPFPYPSSLFRTQPPPPASPSSAPTDPRFALIRIPGDGSCLFRALAQGNHALSNGGALLDKAGLLAAGFDLRRSICVVLTARRAAIEPFLDCPFQAYIDAMSLEGTWGGEPELSAAPVALKRPVCVYQATARGPLGGVAALKKVSAYGVDRFPTTPPVCVLFSGNHYDLLLQE